MRSFRALKTNQSQESKTDKTPHEFFKILEFCLVLITVIEFETLYKVASDIVILR